MIPDDKVILSEDGLESIGANRADGTAVEIIKGLGRDKSDYNLQDKNGRFAAGLVI